MSPPVVAEEFLTHPWPMMAVTRAGEITLNRSLRDLLGLGETPAGPLTERFDIARVGAPVLAEEDLPWRRAGRGETFVDEEIWYDREAARRLQLHLRSHVQEGRTLVAFESIAEQPFSTRLADLLATISGSLLTADDPSQLPQTILEEVSRGLGADAVFLMAADRGDEGLSLTASLGVPPGFLQERGAAPGDSITALAARTGEIQEVDRIEDLPIGSLRDTRRLLELGLRSAVAFPLLAGGELVGVLELARRQHGKLNSLERRLLSAVASTCALGLRQTRLRAAERRETLRLRTLREAASAIEAALPLRDLLRRLVEQACELTRARYGALGVLNREGSGLSDFLFVGVPADVADRIGHLPEGRGLLGAVIREAKPIRVPSVHDDPRSVGFPAHHPPMTSFLGVPLLIGREVFGNFYLCDKDGGIEFSEEDERLVQLFAAQSSLAIAYARQLKVAEGAHAELHRLRGEFEAIIAHDLRGPVAAMLLQIEDLLRGATDGRVSAPVAALERVRRSARRVSQMAGDLLDASSLELKRLALDRSPVSLQEAVTSLVADIEPTLGDHPISVDVEGEPPAVSVDGARLDQILTNLLDNAAKYSSPESPIRVVIQPAPGGASVTVEDRGIGIAAEEIPRLFDSFYQASRARARRTGLGLGLYITKGLVEAHGGMISVESTPGLGSRFRVWFPETPPMTAQIEAHPA
jgi:signal transduction histidine kinase